MSKSLCIIDASKIDKSLLRAVDALSEQVQGDSQVFFVAFADDSSKELLTRFKKKCDNVSFLSSAELMDEVFDLYQKTLWEFVSDLRFRLVGAATEVCGAPFGERFARMWWYTKLSEKNCLGEAEWWVMLRFLVVRQVLQSEKVDSCMYVGSRELGGLIEQYCMNVEVSYVGDVVCRLRQKSQLKLLRERLRKYMRQVVTLLQAKDRGTQGAVDGRPEVALVTEFPRMWGERFGELQDMYYGTVFQELGKLGVSPHWICNLHNTTDRGVSCDEFSSSLKRLINVFSLGTATVTESFASIFDYSRNFFRLSDLWSYRKLRSSSQLRQAFEWEGVNVFELLQPLLDQSILVQWPYLQSIEDTYARMAACVRPKKVLLYTFEYSWGRAWMQGLRRGCPDVEVVGLQHGPAAGVIMFGGTPEELGGWYPLPIPDRAFVDGEVGTALLKARGMSEMDVIRVGACRFDAVWGRAAEGASLVRGNDFRVLVAPGLHDSGFVIPFILHSLGGLEGVEVIIRPHPKVSDEAIEKIASSPDLLGGNVSIERSGTIYDWMLQSDLFISTYSSTGVESLAYGVPTIILASGRLPDLSMFRATNTPVYSVKDVDELRKRVLELANNSDEHERYLTQLLPALEKSFSTPDGEAAQRVARACIETQQRSTL